MNLEKCLLFFSGLQGRNVTCIYIRLLFNTEVPLCLGGNIMDHIN